MRRLALDLGIFGNAFALQRGRYTFDGSVMTQLMEALGHRAAFGRYAGANAEHIGMARLDAIKRLPNSDDYEAVLADIVVFNPPLAAEIAPPGANSACHWLGDLEWLHMESTVLAFVQAGNAEAAGSPPLENYSLIYNQLLKSYDHRCAFTGATLHPQVSQDDTETPVVAIRPLVAGGALHVGNLIVLGPEAAHAFTLGHIAVGPDYRLIADLRRIDPELLERLLPAGLMLLPADPRYWPDPANLAYHREHIFARAP